MEPNFVDGQLLVINKIAYLVDQPKRGDAVAMFFPGEKEKRFIKRIIGLPGENLKIQKGKVVINEKILNEPYLEEMETLPDLERNLESGEYFVMGDNRLNSSDSRAWGPVPSSFLIGKISIEIFRLPPAEAAE